MDNQAKSHFDLWFSAPASQGFDGTDAQRFELP